MLSIENLWQRRVEEVLGIIAAGETSHRELAILSEYVEADYHGRFLAELLQNANDQAVKSSIGESSVSIVRTTECIGVANRGDPFDQGGIRSITSIGLSPKDPSVLIGNKGVGFKSVFQVSHSPEIYSAPVFGGTFLADDAVRFRLSLTPFEEEQHDALLKSTVEAALVENPGLAEKITADGFESVSHRVVSEVKRAAPFKFPIQVPNGDASSRSESLPGIDEESETLIALPLLEGDETQEIVSDALEELLGSFGASILFLPGISRIKIDDHVLDRETVIRRRSTLSRAIPGRHEKVDDIETQVMEGSEVVSTVNWRVVSGAAGVGDEVAADRLNEAAQDLPGASFEDVRHCPVSVALPVFENGLNDTGSQIFNGKFCIGLPTHDHTGTIAWLHSHFYGNISRKDIDLETCRFNQLLFEEALRLHDVLLDDLRRDDNLSHRRAATLAYHDLGGPLADVLHHDAELAEQEIILAEDGRSFIAPEDVILPRPQEYRLLQKLMTVAPTTDVRSGLPEEVLAMRAHSIVSDICEYYSDDDQLHSLFLERDADGKSTLEKVAKQYRGEGKSFWVSFVEWMASSFDDDDLVEQKVLPVGGSGLCSPEERVFILPVPRSTDDSDDDDEEGAEDLESLPADVRASLKFLDESAIPVRTGKGRALTEIAAKLAPQGGGLVRRPRLVQLINDAIGPAMAELDASEHDFGRGIALLELAVKWLSRMSPKARSNVDDRSLRVPVANDSEDHDAKGDWVPAIDAYFGAGWLDTRAEELLIAAYGHRQKTMLISWPRFEALTPDGLRNRSYWCNVMADIGVSHAPKLILHSDRRRRPPLVAWSNDYLSVVESPICPMSSAKQHWSAYLTDACHRPAETRSGQPFNFEEVSWLDGLERPESRDAILALVLANPDNYEGHLETKLSRADMRNQDASIVASLWVHAIRSNDWAVLPTNKGLRRPSESWLLAPGQTGKARRRLDVLTFVDHIYRRAERILLAIGVAPLDYPAANRIVDEIDRIARTLPTASSGEKVKSLAMVEDLFGRLQASVTEESESGAQEIPRLDDKWIPFKKANDVVGVAADEIESAYLVDDPERAKFVADFDQSLVWPIQPRGAFRSFAAQLREGLGDRSVEFTSNATVDTGFSPTDQAEIPLLQWIKKTFPMRDVVTDIGCLIAYAGNRETDPNGPRFASIWRKFQTANLMFGTFPNNAPSRSFFDEQQENASQLQVDHRLGDFETLTSTWRLVAKAYEDTWYRYADRLERESAEEFMKEKVATLAQREEVTAVIGGSSAIFQPLRALFFSLIYEDALDAASISDFEEAWDKNSLATATLSSWVQGRISPETLSGINFDSVEETIQKCIRESGITVEHWQAARAVLGEPPFKFANSESLWSETTKRVGALLRATVARSPLVDLNAIEGTLNGLETQLVPAEIAEKPCTAHEILARVLSSARQVIGEVETSRVRELLNRRLNSLSELKIAAPHEIKLEDPPSRDVYEYLEKSSAQREIDAQAHLESLLYVANRVAELIGEDVDLKAVNEVPRIQQLVSGSWANAYCLVAAFQASLDELAPQTLRAFSEKRAFGTKKSRNEMLALFPELVASVPIEKPSPEPVIELFGQMYSQEEINNELSMGANGRIGRAVLDAAVSRQIEFDSFGGERGRPVRPKRTKTKRKTPSRKKFDAQAKNAKNDLVGMLGEIYVYELLRNMNLSDFDDSAWKSGMRNKYMADNLGDDTLGYDIEFVDTDSILTRNDKAVSCLIEVKATSGDGQSPFQMSVGEWERATEAHYNESEEYFIARVENVLDPERIAIASIIRDPYGCRRRNELELVANDFWVYAGPVIEDSRDKLGA